MRRVWLGAAAIAILVGLATAASSAGVGTFSCSHEGTIECLQLVQLLARRVGVVSGAMTMIILMSTVGMLRMLAIDDQQRAQDARDAFVERVGAEKARALLPE